MNSVFDSTSVQPLILELLARRNRFEPKQLQEFAEMIEKAGATTLPEVTLVKAAHLEDQEIADIYVEDLFLPLAPRRDDPSEIDRDLASLLPEKLCIDKLICPLALRDDTLDVVFVSPESMGVVDELQLLTGLRISPDDRPPLRSPVAARCPLPSQSRKQGHRRGERGFQDAAEDDRGSRREHTQPRHSAPNDANGRVVRMVNQILEQAMRNGASDIHLEPFEDGCKFRLRIDGVIARAALAVESRVHHDHLATEDPGQDGHRREAHSPGRRHRGATGEKRDGPSRQHRPHRLRREDGHANSRQGETSR